MLTSHGGTIRGTLGRTALESALSLKGKQTFREIKHFSLQRAKSTTHIVRRDTLHALAHSTSGVAIVDRVFRYVVVIVTTAYATTTAGDTAEGEGASLLDAGSVSHRLSRHVKEDDR